jgi:hypothetical protein
VDRKYLLTGSPGLFKTDWLLADLVRVTRPDPSDRSYHRQTGAARKAAPPPVRQVYKPKQREEVQKMEVDPERTTSQDIIQIGSMDVSIGEDGKRPIVPNNKFVTSTPEVAANDHEASGSSSNSKYFLPRWCPPGLTAHKGGSFNA